jgi:hypothetical protein
MYVCVGLVGRLCWAGRPVLNDGPPSCFDRPPCSCRHYVSRSQPAHLTCRVCTDTTSVSGRVRAVFLVCVVPTSYLPHLHI